MTGGTVARLLHCSRSPAGKRVVALGSVLLAAGLAIVAARQFASSLWPLPHAHPGLLLAAAALFLLSSVFKAYGWRRLFAVHDAPGPLALAAANGGAAVMGLALPGRFDDVVRVAIVRRSPGCRAGVGTLCFSLFMLGLIDSAALAPLAGTAAVMPGSSTGMRALLALVAGAGVGAAALIVAWPRLSTSRRVLRFRLGRWLQERATPFRGAWQAWALVSVCWLVRGVALFLVLGGIGVGFSLPLALLFLCASAASSALPVGPAGAVVHAGAGAAVLAASGVGGAQAIGAAVTVSALGIGCACATLLVAAAWCVRLRWRPSTLAA